MYYRILKTGNDYPDVLLRKSQSEEGYPIVVISAIGHIDGNDFRQEIAEEVIFDEEKTALAFIKLYNDVVANEWCEMKNITY